ncbi:hypothetical protein Gogos_019968, partial [Gossypium gossypioides]|nr:hypothetical protein [Gossypium gossypioides]
SRLLTDRWIAPTGSTDKINFDAAFNRQRKESCLGLVVQNEKVEVICSRTVMHENIPSDSAAETKEADRTEIKVFINESKQLCSSFRSCVFQFTYRESNKATHILATEGLKRRETTYLMNEVTSFVVKEVDADRRWTKSVNA